MCSMGKDLKARNANQGPVATVVVVAAVSMLKNTVAATPVLVKPNPRVRSPHYLQPSAGGVEKQDTRKARSARHLSQSAGIVESKEHYEKVCMMKSAHLVNAFQSIPVILNFSTMSVNLENLFMCRDL